MSPHEDPQLEVRARELAEKLKQACDATSRQIGRSVGFTLLLYDHGPGGFLSYMSNSGREGVVEMMKEFIGKAERGEV